MVMVMMVMVVTVMVVTVMMDNVAMLMGVMVCLNLCWTSASAGVKPTSSRTALYQYGLQQVCTGVNISHFILVFVPLYSTETVFQNDQIPGYR